MNESQTAPADITHDVYFGVAGQKLHFRNPNHGITISDHALSWTLDGQPDSATFSSIASVHLQTTATGSPIGLCIVTLRDGQRLTVTSGNSLGAANGEQAAIYRNFVHDFHRRLAANQTAAIDFTAGFAPGRYTVVVVCAVLLGLIVVAAPLIAVFAIGTSDTWGVLIGGCLFLWPLVKIVQANKPRTYDPREVPDDVIP